MNDATFNSVVLAALLHDIGKFMQRANVPLSVQSKSMENQICRKIHKTDHYGYRHVLWTNQFFHETNTTWCEPDNIDLTLCSDLASSHHRHDIEPLQAIIKYADWLSAGFDRDPEEDHSTGKLRYKTVPLYSIFDNISLSSNETSTQTKGYNLTSLDPSNDLIFPHQMTGDSLDEQKYMKLWEDFNAQLNAMPNNLPFRQYLAHINALLERYTWCIPANTREATPDVSLFDHAATTAAIAACLYEYHKTNNTLDNLEQIADRTIEKFILVAGDLSGIQKFILNINKEKSRGVSKILRARSFYLAVSARAICISLLEKLGLPQLCLLQDIGGRFLLLLPNVEEVKTALHDIQKDIDAWYWKSFYGELVFTLQPVAKLKGEDFQMKNFRKILRESNRKLATAKNRKLSRALLDEKTWNTSKFLFEEDRYSSDICAMCTKKPSSISHKIDETEESVSLCEICDNLIALGSQITKNDTLVYSRHSSKQSYTFLPDTPFAISMELKTVNSPRECYDTDTVFIEKMHYDSQKHYYPVFPIANYVPRKDNEILTFEQIASCAVDETNKKGSSHLSVFKADMDNLGYIFSRGLGDDISISRYRTLSRMINLFFCARLPELIRQKFPNIYVIFAGGDDLTILSDWVTIEQFIPVFRQEFSRYFAENNDITLSAGIATVHNHLPIRRAMECAEELLEQSKHSGKNRVTYFNTTVTWEDFAGLMDKACQLQSFLDSEDEITTGFLYNLLEYHRMAMRVFDGNLTHSMDDLLYRSRIHYDVGRRKIKNDQTKHELIAMSADDHLMKNLRIPLFSVLYKNRKHTQKEETL